LRAEKKKKGGKKGKRQVWVDLAVAIGGDRTAGKRGVDLTWARERKKKLVVTVLRRKRAVLCSQPDRRKKTGPLICWEDQKRGGRVWVGPPDRGGIPDTILF